MRKVLTIGGTDCSGGAGIQADLKTMTAHQTYGMSVITAVIAQNTTGVIEIMEVHPSLIEKQIDAVFTDIEPDAVKIGMVSNTEIMEMIAKKLTQYHAKNIVVDPVMVATSGDRLMSERAITTLQKTLLPLAKVITPNIFEAEILSSRKIHSTKDMFIAATTIFEKTKVPILLKGGHLSEEASDLLFDGQEHWYKGERIENPNTHGTGCTLSSAIACQLAQERILNIAIYQAKKYVTECLCYGLDLGHGSGPLHHMARYQNK